MSEALGTPASPPKRRFRPWRWLAFLTAGLVWLAVLAALWWWVPHPARATLATSDSLLLVGFSEDGETLVTARPPRREEGSRDDMPLATFIVRMSQIWSTRSGPIQAWDCRTGTERARFAEDWERIEAVAISPKGDILAAENGAGNLKVWDLRTGQVRADLKAETVGTFDTQTFWLSPDGRTLAWLPRTDSQKRPWANILKLCDTATGTDRLTLPLSDPVRTVAFSPDSKTLAVGTFAVDGNVTLWDVFNGERKAALRAGREGHAVFPAFSPDGRTLATGTEIQTMNVPEELTLWDIGESRRRVSAQEPGPFAQPFTGLTFSPDGAFLVAKQGSHQKTYSIWDTPALRRLDFKGTTRPAFSPDGSVLAVTDDLDFVGVSLVFAVGRPATPQERGRAVRLLDPATMAERARLEARWWSSIDPPVFSPDGKLVAASGSYLPARGWALNEVKVWDAGSGREEATLRGYSAPLFSPGGNSLTAIGGGTLFGGTVTVWDVPVPTRAWRLAGAIALWALVPILVRKWYLARRRKRESSAAAA
jgi:WD40 repeat protein